MSLTTLNAGWGTTLDPLAESFSGDDMALLPEFDGSTQYAQRNDEAALDISDNDFTLGCWFKLNGSLVSNTGIVMKGPVNSSLNEYGIYHTSSGGMRFGGQQQPATFNNNVTLPSSSIAVDTYYFAVLRFDEANEYIRARLNETDTDISWTDPWPTASTSHLWFGGHGTTGNIGKTAVSLGGVFLCNGGHLSNVQLSAIYGLGKPADSLAELASTLSLSEAATTSLFTGYWPMNDPEDFGRDISGNGRSLTITGGPLPFDYGPGQSASSSPRRSEPGRGSLNLTLTDGKQGQYGNRWFLNPQTTPTWGDLGFDAPAVKRQSGKIFATTFKIHTWEELGIGWHGSAAVADPDSFKHAIQANGTDGQLDNEDGILILDGLAINTEYRAALVLDATGAYYYIHNGSNWILVWMEDLDTTSTLYPVVSNLDGYPSFSQVDVHRRLWTPTAVVDTSSPADLDSGTLSSGDGLIECTFEAPGGGPEDAFINYRQSTPGDSWRIGCLASSGEVVIDKLTTGSPANQLTTSSTPWIGGETITVRVVTRGSDHHGYYRVEGGVWTYLGKVTDATYASDTAFNLDAPDVTLSSFLAYDKTPSDIPSWV